MTDPQQITKAAYENPDLVEGYIAVNGHHEKVAALVTEFAQTCPGKQLLDLGCGPGHVSHQFAELGFAVTGVDYSTEMIRRARTLRHVTQPPTFLVGDMRQLSQLVPAHSFDAIWASASLLHIPEADIPQVLSQISAVAKPGAHIYISLKGGSGTQLVAENKYGVPMERQFILWTKEAFLELVEPENWQLTDFKTTVGGQFMGKPTEWLHFYFTVVA